jgi:uncharacterized protein YegL
MTSIRVSPSISGNILAVHILPSAGATTARRAFHLAMVLDVSGSMDGDRISSLKRTINLLVDRLADDDKVSIISYNHESTVCVNASRIADDRAAIHSAVDGLTALGGTNMEAGMMALRTLSAEPDAVFILTDGQINSGIASSAGLMRILTSVVPTGTPVNTLGYGADHNVRLLRDMAVRSRGTYTYADVAEILPAIIGDITAGLASEIARGAHIAVPAGWKCLELCADESAHRFTIGTLIDQKSQWVVFERTGDAADPTDITVSYTGGSLTASVGSHHTSVDVAEQYARVRVANVFTGISDLLERHDMMEARNQLNTLAADLDASAAKDMPLVIRLRAQVDEMLESLATPPATPHFAGMLPPILGAGVRGPHGLSYMPSFGAGLLAPLPLAPTVSRLVSNAVSLGLQRGVVSTGSEVDTTFSSPMQRRVTANLTATYSGASAHEDPSSLPF